MSGPTDFDVCVIGSGAGGGPVARTLAETGHSVVVLEKGPWRREADFVKDEIAVCRRDAYVPDRRDEPRVIELPGQGAWPTHETGWELWNACLVGGATNLMSGYFHRLQPNDFRLLSAYGPIEGADVADWPIDYDTLEPWYDLVERTVGVAGRVVDRPRADRRSRPDFPFPPIAEHPLATWIDQIAPTIGAHPFPVPRAVLPTAWQGRRGCEYSGYCAMYGCASGAKGSSRTALIEPAIATGRCEVRPFSMARRIRSDARGRARTVEYHDVRTGEVKRLDARVFVVACQPIETARLLLASTGPRHPNGLANGSALVGRHLLFSSGGWGVARLPRASLDPDRALDMLSPLPFVNRALADLYEIDDPALGGRAKGGIIEVLRRHPNPISGAVGLTWRAGKPVWGQPLKARLVSHLRDSTRIKFENFADWLPMPGCRVTLDADVRDRWGLSVARVRIVKHRRHVEIGERLAALGRGLFEALGAVDIYTRVSGLPATNLVAGGCRFGRDPSTSVLDPQGRAHEVDNLYVTDGSFMPTGGSVPYTWTIYANAFRVADHIAASL